MNARQHASLTPTERRVLLLVHHSRKSEAIALLAGMSRHTVDQHLKSARAKLGNVGRYVAADALRTFEQQHPIPLGSESLGMATGGCTRSSTVTLNRSALIANVAENTAPFAGFENNDRLGEAGLLEQWLQERTILSRFVLVLAAASMLLLLIVSAPLLAEQMGQIGFILYREGVAK